MSISFYVPFIVLNFLVEVASYSASDSAYCDTFLRSVVCLSVVCHIRAPCLNRSTDLHAIWQVHLWSPMTHCVRWGSLTLQRKGRFGGWTSSQNLHLPTYDSSGGSTDQRFRLSSNDFDHLLNLGIGNRFTGFFFQTLKKFLLTLVCYRAVCIATMCAVCTRSVFFFINFLYSLICTYLLMFFEGFHGMNCLISWNLGKLLTYIPCGLKSPREFSSGFNFRRYVTLRYVTSCLSVCCANHRSIYINT